jgi:hypothetical protein
MFEHEIGKGERDQDYRPGCKWAHAASSSDRSQSFARAGWLRRALDAAQRQHEDGERKALRIRHRDFHGVGATTVPE